MFVHGLTREGTNEIGLGVVGKREGLGKLVEVLRTHRTLHVELFRLVALTGLDLRTINEMAVGKILISLSLYNLIHVHVHN